MSIKSGFKYTRALLAVAVVLGSTSLYGQSGTSLLDATFGAGGKVTTDFGNASEGTASIALQADGKLVVAGSSSVDGGSDFALARYNSNGTVDTSFGTGGKVTTDFGSPWESATSVAVQQDGKIIATGTTVNGLFADFALARYNSNGTLDTTFGTGGKVLTNTGGVSATPYSVAVQTDGKIIVAGEANLNGGYDFALARYNSNGTLDPTFGTGGIVSTGFDLVGQGFSFAMANSLAVQQDGRIVVAGQAYNGGRYNLALARYNSNGTLDSSFGTGGRVTTDFATQNNFANVAAFSVAVQQDGKIVAAGLAGFDSALARYTSSGALDTSFGAGGKVTTSFSSSYDSLSSIALQGDGKIVATGRTFINGDFHSLLVRYTGVGTLDTGFGTAGAVTNIFGADSEGVSSLVVQPDGKIVVAGGVSVNWSRDFALARFITSSTTGSTPAISFAPIRVNAGAATPYTDPAGVVWAADTGFDGGFSFATGAAIANTATPFLYQTERWNSSTLRYRFVVPNGAYSVRLNFAEIYFSSGAQRIFNIVLNGQTVEMNFDPFTAAAGANTAVDRTYPVNVTGGEIVIELVPVVSNPKISAMEITAR